MVFTLPEINFGWLLPEITVSLTAIVVLLLSVFFRQERAMTLVGTISLIGSGVALLFTWNLWGARVDIMNSLYTIDNFGTFFKILSLIITLLVTLVSLKYVKREGLIKGEYYTLVLLSTLGMMVMVSTNHFITLFIGLELMSIGLYVLCGLLGENVRAVEASLKYFLLGAFATAFLLYGIALNYNTTGILDVRELARFINSGEFSLTPLFMAGMALLIVGFGFKTASVPFHMWTPDVYEGSPTAITAYMATGVKAAAFGAFLRVFYVAFSALLAGWSSILWLMAFLTMTVGNVIALVQDDVKRMLAYSSIAHAGYILITFVIGDPSLSSSILFYCLAYTFMNIGAFTVVIMLSKREGEDTSLEAYAGLAGRHPLVALSMAIFLLSLAGVPPLAGFMAKFYVLAAAIKKGYYGLAIIGVLNSVVAAYYYLRVIMYMYFKEGEREQGRVDISASYSLVLFVSTAALFYIGIFSRDFLLLAGEAVGIFL